MTGDRDVSLPVLTTTAGNHAIFRFQHVSHVPAAIWLSRLVFVHQLACSGAKHGHSVGTQTSFFITSDSADHRERYEIESLINGLQHFESFEESHTIPTVHAMSFTYIVPSEVTILLGLDVLREFGLVINADSAHCYSTKLRCRIPGDFNLVSRSCPAPMELAD